MRGMLYDTYASISKPSHQLRIFANPLLLFFHSYTMTYLSLSNDCALRETITSLFKSTWLAIDKTPEARHAEVRKARRI